MAEFLDTHRESLAEEINKFYPNFVERIVDPDELSIYGMFLTNWTGSEGEHDEACLLIGTGNDNEMIHGIVSLLGDGKLSAEIEFTLSDNVTANLRFVSNFVFSYGVD